jgi:hypothetical protein
VKAQTGWKGAIMTETTWRGEICKRFETLDWERARADVRPFLERERDLDLLREETLLKLLGEEFLRIDG